MAISAQGLYAVSRIDGGIGKLRDYVASLPQTVRTKLDYIRALQFNLGNRSEQNQENSVRSKKSLGHYRGNFTGARRQIAAKATTCLCFSILLSCRNFRADHKTIAIWTQICEGCGRDRILVGIKGKERQSGIQEDAAGGAVLTVADCAQSDDATPIMQNHRGIIGAITFNLFEIAIDY
ncbi:hypothetical protein [Parasphingorhabdus halotolerans]|uniref:Uncharacterized protein n=1 Tax=Parasphingorhabdus halotolerans TaxID=2725558 RepID=A0A6H2DN07_9SPHN|nr:hypothetical protein [Parasphingorhabdus halotolerans]QJB69517.1 hypothetical protein HF685_09675 [Parasphingorhabdus halotolerans]